MKIAYLLCDISTHFVPDVFLGLPEIDGFLIIDNDRWSYNTGYREFEFKIGENVYDSSCPILGIYDLDNFDHFKNIVNRSFHQQVIREDLHLHQ